MRCNRFNLVTVGICCVLVLVIGCQEQAGTGKVSQGLPERVKAPEVNEAAIGGPRITFDKVVDDFGEVGPGTRKTGEFKITNSGDKALEITRVDECCGVVTSLSKKELAPAETGTLTVDYRGSQQSGTVRRQIFVNSNDKTNPRVGLTITVRIVAKVDHEPKSLNLLLKGDANCPSITLTSLDDKPFSIKGFKSTGDCITLDVNNVAQATKFVLQPKVDTQKLRKGLNGFLEISLTHPDCDTVTIPFNTLSEFEVNPPLIIVFNAEPKKVVERDLWILSNYSQDFEIESASSQNNYITVLGREKINKGYQLKLQITPPAAEANQRIFTDVFTVSIKGGEKLTVTCRGFYQRKR